LNSMEGIRNVVLGNEDHLPHRVPAARRRPSRTADPRLYGPLRLPGARAGRGRVGARIPPLPESPPARQLPAQRGQCLMRRDYRRSRQPESERRAHGPEPRFQMRLASGAQRIIRWEEEDSFFRAIEQRTGLDRAMAEAILLSGKPITHPDATFFLYDIRGS